MITKVEKHKAMVRRTVPTTDTIIGIVNQTVDKTPQEIQNPLPENETANIGWLNSPDDTLKPLFTFRAPEQLSEQLKEIADTTGVSQNYSVLEAAWVVSLSKMLEHHPDDENVKASIRTSLKKPRRGWRERTLNDVLDEHIKALTHLKSMIDDETT